MKFSSLSAPTKIEELVGAEREENLIGNLLLLGFVLAKSIIEPYLEGTLYMRSHPNSLLP